MSSRKNFSRHEQKVRVVKQFALWIEQGKRDPVTMNRIAKALDMTPSPHLRDILLEMVNEGTLQVESREQSGRWETRFFALVENSDFSKVKLFRRVAVKIKGQNVGQLEMAI